MYHPIIRIVFNLLVFLLVLLDADFNDVLCQHSTDGKLIYTINQYKHFYIFILLKHATIKMYFVMCVKRNARIVG